ncbi:MAG: hypothetical protein FWF90_13415, partial [Promicromonosporaceae bacterium]|nr:hypothetical protein [Promicromonosporaceae bacterium]
TAAATAAAGTAAAGAATTVGTVGAVSAGAALGGTSVMAAAGAVAVAAVGVVTVLQVMAPPGEAATSTHNPPAAVVAPAVSLAAPTLAPSASPSAEPSLAPSPSPSDIGPLLDAPVLALGQPAELSVEPVSTGPLTPRVPQRVALSVTNQGDQTARGTTARFMLPPGLDLQGPTAPAGKAASVVPLTTDALACRADSTDPQAVLCDLGDVPGGDTADAAFVVVAHDGGTYEISGSVWADGVASTPVDMAPTDVTQYGAELSAQVGAVGALLNPGTGEVPLAVVNTGDSPAAAGWSVDVTLPPGTRLAGSGGGLTCTAGQAGPQDVTCTAASPAALAPGDEVAGTLSIVAPASADASGTASLEALPVSQSGDHIVSGSALVTVQPLWQGAGDGAGSVASQCAATGGVNTADAVVTGSYRNATQEPVTVRLDAAGSSATSGVLQPGDSATLTAHDGIRVPAGQATWTLTTTVAGTDYATTVPASTFTATDCYDPSWAVTSSVALGDVGGQVRVAGTITNTSPEPMNVTLLAAGQSSAAKALDPGDTATLTIDTGATQLSAGTATFALSRFVVDTDGDQPAAPEVPPVPVTASYGDAVIAPALGALSGDPFVGDCQYDPATETSSRVVAVPLDNSASTLPVTFVVGSTTTIVPAGQTQTVQVPVSFGTAQLVVLADGKAVGTVPTPVTSCATLVWPTDVTITATAQCTDKHTPQLVVTLGDASRAFTARITPGRGLWTGPVVLTADAPRTVTIGLGTWRHAHDGKVTVELSRDIEGATFTVKNTVSYKGVRCFVPPPAARTSNPGSSSGHSTDSTPPADPPATPSDPASPASAAVSAAAKAAASAVASVPAAPTVTSNAAQGNGQNKAVPPGQANVPASDRSENSQGNQGVGKGATKGNGNSQG